MAVSILLARALVEGVENAGTSRAAFLEQAGLTSERLDDVEERLDVEEYASMIELALDITGDQALGLHMGIASNAATYSLIAPLVSHAASLRQALEGLFRFHRLLTDRDPMRVIERNRTVTLVYLVGTGSERCRRFWSESTVAGWYKMLRYFARGARPDRIAFEYAAPPYRAEYTRAFEGAESFGEEYTGLVFDRSFMDVIQPNRDPEFHAALEAQAERRVARLTGKLTIKDRLRDHVMTAKGRWDMEATARALGMSARSLRRRLREEGVSYNDVVERALATLSTRLLVDERRTIQDVAYAMRFSDPSAFSRAFKRWTGSTPNQYRMQHTRPRSDVAGRAAPSRAVASPVRGTR
jgi:AraC-like DNA-binding protein